MAGQTHAERRADRKEQAIAATFEPNPGLDRVLELKRTDRAAYEKLSPERRMAAGYYQAAKAAAQRVATARSEGKQRIGTEGGAKGE